MEQEGAIPALSSDLKEALVLAVGDSDSQRRAFRKVICDALPSEQRGQFQGDLIITGSPGDVVDCFWLLFYARSLTPELQTDVAKAIASAYRMPAVQEWANGHVAAPAVERPSSLAAGDVEVMRQRRLTYLLGDPSRLNGEEVTKEILPDVFCVISECRKATAALGALRSILRHLKEIYEVAYLVCAHSYRDEREANCEALMGKVALLFGFCRRRWNLSELGNLSRRLSFFLDKRCSHGQDGRFAELCNSLERVALLAEDFAALDVRAYQGIYRDAMSIRDRLEICIDRLEFACEGRLAVAPHLRDALGKEEADPLRDSVVQAWVEMPHNREPLLAIWDESGQDNEDEHRF